MPFVEAEGEAAFYGPKIDIQAKNVYGKEDTMITIQLDCAIAENLICTTLTRMEINSVHTLFTEHLWDATREHLHGSSRNMQVSSLHGFARTGACAANF